MDEVEVSVAKRCRWKLHDFIQYSQGEPKYIRAANGGRLKYS